MKKTTPKRKQTHKYENLYMEDFNKLNRNQ